MNNAELFKRVFGIYAEEFWTYTETKMLNWINADVTDTNVEDTISRQVAINALRHVDEYNGRSIETIRNLPSAEPEHKKGKWIKMSDADGIYYCCSECSEELYRNWSFDREFDLFPKKESIERTSFCPNCGADMRGDAK